MGEEPGSLGARVVGNQLEGVLKRLPALLGPGQRPLDRGAIAERGRLAGRLGLLVELVDGVIDQLQRAVVGAVEVMRPPGSQEQLGEVAAGKPLGVVDAVPELERPVEESGGGAARPGLLRLAGGTDRRGKSLRLVARSVVVVGDGGAEPDARIALGAALGERPRDRQVQVGALARQQVVVKDLAQEHVAELVAVLLAAVDELGADRVAERPVERPRVEAGDLGDERVVGAAGHRERPQCHLGLLGQALEPDQKRVAERRRQGAAPVGSGGDHLLGEERVAVGAAEHPLDHLGRGSGVEDVLELERDLVAVEPGQLEVARARGALELGELGAHRVAPVKLVGAVGEQRQNPLLAQAGRQEGHERAGRAIGPVHVLEPENDGRPRAEAVEQREHGLEQAPL